MHDPERRPPQLTENDLIGAWEAFKGDGVHGLHYRVIVFRRDDAGLFLEYWLPAEGKSKGELHLFSIEGVDCVPSAAGLTIVSRGDDHSHTLELCPTGDEIIFLTIPQTTAGATYFRRTAIPKNESGKRLD
ncbi:MAG: hypothetical protein JWN51_2351 [Phycisphaerales bacterium]|jgi:hypothetical protein|nr:hypothetical protein [Phycisphaerales bacterium]